MTKPRSYETGEALASMATDAREHVTEIVDAVRHDASELKRSAQSKVDDAKQYVSEKADAARERANEFKDEDLARIKESGVAYVRSNPASSLLMAVGVGLLIGYTLASRRQ